MSGDVAAQSGLSHGGASTSVGSASATAVSGASASGGAEHGVSQSSTSTYRMPVRAAQYSADHPFKPSQLARIDEALTLASRETGLTFSVFVGGFGGPSREVAEAMFAKLAGRFPAPVLLAISPGERRLEVVTGGAAAHRIPNRVCGLAALAMRASFSNGDLTGGIVNGLRQLADAAGTA